MTDVYLNFIILRVRPSEGEQQDRVRNSLPNAERKASGWSTHYSIKSEKNEAAKRRSSDQRIVKCKALSLP